jgi:3-phosphoshikimate 1-carboxyvinyltransferase
MSIANQLSLPQQKLSGTVILESSKSISNRALIIRSLSKDPFEIHRLSSSDDTKALIAMLTSTEEVLHSGHAGSSYRFMVARACLGDREVKLDASEQLRRRPIGPLVKALQSLGADITYLQKEGFPPLQIKPTDKLGVDVNEVTLQAGISSQYLTSLLLIAPMLPNGLTIHLTDELVSASYVQMTLAMMAYFGIEHQWTDNTIRVEHGAYTGRDYAVEGDWSAASYYYSMTALAEHAEIFIEGLREDSIQGDAVTKEIYSQLGVETTFTENGLVINKKGIQEKPKEFKYDFSSCPDIAQTVMVTLAGLGVKGVLTGLKTLRIKETDRILAMFTELERVKTKLLVKEEGEDLTVIVVGKAKWKDRGKFNTYEDHRMAMAFTPLACIHPVIIKDPDVVSKSYPAFWKDIIAIGIKCEKIKVK